MAVFQSVVRGPLGVPEVQEDPWLVPRVWFGDLWGSLRDFQGGPWLVNKVWFGDLLGPCRGVSKGIHGWFPKCGLVTSRGP